MKKATWIVAICLIVLAGGLLTLHMIARSFWERMLWGPFTGVPYVGSIEGEPTSVLSLSSRGRIEAHSLSSLTNPVVVFRSSDGAIAWSRLLRPERKLDDGTFEYAGMRNLRLRSWDRRRGGSVVFVTCDWDWGGKEGGLIELDDDFAFRSFSLSW